VEDLVERAAAPGNHMVCKRPIGGPPFPYNHLPIARRPRLVGAAAAKIAFSSLAAIYPARLKVGPFQIRGLENFYQIPSIRHLAELFSYFPGPCPCRARQGARTAPTIALGCVWG